MHKCVGNSTEILRYKIDNHKEEEIICFDTPSCEDQQV